MTSSMSASGGLGQQGRRRACPPPSGEGLRGAPYALHGYCGLDVCTRDDSEHVLLCWELVESKKDCFPKGITIDILARPGRGRQCKEGGGAGTCREKAPTQCWWGCLHDKGNDATGSAQGHLQRQAALPGTTIRRRAFPPPSRMDSVVHRMDSTGTVA